MAYTNKVSLVQVFRDGRIGPKDDIYTVSDFMDAVSSHSFVDYDGYGFPVKEGRADPDIWIHPSGCPGCIPKDATHIIWYNK